jgi:hypothetical protein
VQALQKEQATGIFLLQLTNDKCVRDSVSVACVRCKQRGRDLRECGPPLLPSDDPTPRRARQKVLTDDPEEIELLQNHRAKRAIQRTQSESAALMPFHIASTITPLHEEGTNSLEFLGAAQNASRSPDISNPEHPSSNEESMSGMVVEHAESGSSFDLPSMDELEAYFSLFLN